MASKYPSSSGPGLHEFLIEAELQQYFHQLKNDLKIQNIAQLKYVEEEDMEQIGMSKPEMRRLKKYFHKHFPQTYLGKMKKKLLSRGDGSGNLSRSISPWDSGGEPARSNCLSQVAPGRHIIQADSIIIHKTLGSGEFGTVQQGVWTSDDGQRIQVAIKCLSEERMENNPVEFLKEASIMHAVNHEHIVRLYGVVLDTSALMLVTELAPLRSLLECLKEPSMLPNLSVPTLTDFANQICDGMQYLESKRLIHRDLAARNILVFSRSKVKISDFGLSRALGVGRDYYQSNFNVNLKLPIAWCAPECINFLRFTSASDVWAFGVTLWEMFTYGFQPWAALTGQQILEAIDEPNFQRLEQPQSCPNDIYVNVMMKCWQHDPQNRPTFSQLSAILSECKPEQVQTVRASERARRDFLAYEVGEIITVLEKNVNLCSDENGGGGNNNLHTYWKGVLKDGRVGYFNASNTVSYLGSAFPSSLKENNPFVRNDSRSSSMRKGRISADMISGPQGDLKHTGHVGPDGQFFGDLTFISSKPRLPHQVVSPIIRDAPGPSSCDPLIFPRGPLDSTSSNKSVPDSSDTVPLISTNNKKGSTTIPPGAPTATGAGSIILVNNCVDHEYHEISDEDNDLGQEMAARSRELNSSGVENPALTAEPNSSPSDSPRFDKSFDLESPSLVDEVFGALHSSQQPPELTNATNEWTENRKEKKFATVKPISSSERKTLDQAIAIANELASRSMLDLDRSNRIDESPKTPNSPGHRKKFSFILGGRKSDNLERRNYSQEAASIPDIQSTLTEEAKDAYNSLIQKPSLSSLALLTPSFENKSFHFPEKTLSKKTDLLFEPVEEPSSTKGNIGIRRKQRPCNLNLNPEEETDQNPLRLLRQQKIGGLGSSSGSKVVNNVLPLPPRDRSGALINNLPRHQRKHPLLIPGKVPLMGTKMAVGPPPPPKPQRHNNNGGGGEARAHMRSSSIDVDNNYYESREKPVIHRKTASMDGGSTTAGTSGTIIMSEEHSFGAPKKEETNDSNANNNLPKNVDASEAGVPPLYENYENIETNDSPTDNNGNGEILEKSGNTQILEKSGNTQILKKSGSTQIAEKSENSHIETEPSGTKSFQNDNNNGTIEGENKDDENGNPPPPIICSEWISKVKTIHRILGSTISSEDCLWALEGTGGDAAHAVKLLRLRALLPESMICGPTNLSKVVSALEMSHWDVARASAFLLAARSSSAVKLAPIPAPRPSRANNNNKNDELRPTQV